MATLGIDIGCISVKMAVVGTPAETELLNSLACSSPLFLSPDGGIGIAPAPTAPPVLATAYRRIKGSPAAAAHEMLTQLQEILPAEFLTGIRVTGTGSRNLSRQMGVPYENEFKAIARGMGALYPEITTVFEMGGETSKFILLETDRETGRVGIADYQTNGDCAAGTGSFMDQQANRLLYDIEDVGDIVCGAGKAATIAGRCSVFAKSDMIHAQQKGYQPPEVLKGLCNAVIRNYRGTIAKGKDVQGKVAFIGGVAANKGATDAVREAFDLTEDRLVVPRYYAWMGAIGAALLEADQESGSDPMVMDLTGLLGRSTSAFPTSDALTLDRVILLRDRVKPYVFAPGARPHRRVPGRGRRLRLHQPGGAGHRRRGGQGDLRQDRRPARGSGQQGPQGHLRGDGPAAAHPRRGHHRLRPGTDRGTDRRGHRERRDHRPQDRLHLHRPPPAERPHPGHHLRDRRAGQQVHQPGGRYRGGLRHEPGLRRRHRLLPRGAGREAGHQHHRGVRGVGAVVGGAHPPGRALHGLHGARRELVPAARRGEEGPGGRPRLLHRLQLPQPAGGGAQDRRHHLLPGRHRVQRFRGRRLQPDPGPGDHRAAAQRRAGSHRHGTAGPREDGGHRGRDHLPRLGPGSGALHHQGVHLQGLHQRVRYPPVHHRRREDLLGRQVLGPLPQAGQDGQEAGHPGPARLPRSRHVLLREPGGRGRLHGHRRPGPKRHRLPSRHRGYPPDHVHLRPPPLLGHVLQGVRFRRAGEPPDRQARARDGRGDQRGRTLLPHPRGAWARGRTAGRGRGARLPAQPPERGDGRPGHRVARLSLGPDPALGDHGGPALRRRPVTGSSPPPSTSAAAPCSSRRRCARP